MNPVAKILISVGVALILGGLLWQLSSRMGFEAGKLPGDIVIKRPGFSFYFPLTTSILFSVGVTLVVYLIRLLSRK